MTLRNSPGKALRLDNLDLNVVFESEVTIQNTIEEGMYIENVNGEIHFENQLSVSQSGLDANQSRGTGHDLYFGPVEIFAATNYRLNLIGDDTGTPDNIVAFQSVLNVASVDIWGIKISARHGNLSFADINITITINDNNASGFVLDSAATFTDPVMIGDFDLSSLTAVGTTGIDLGISSGGQTLFFGDTNPNGLSSRIEGVEYGIRMGPFTSVNCVFGDGENVIDMGSAILATNPIVGLGLPPVGTFNFVDAGL